MKYKQTITVLAFFIAVVAIAATTMGIFTTDGPGSYQYQSIVERP
jgi:hypothetical protein